MAACRAAADRGPVRRPREHPAGTSEPRYAGLRERAAKGDRDAVDELIELAGERGDLAELRRLGDLGYRDAVDELVQRASELDDLTELRRLADEGNADAADVLHELTEECAAGAPWAPRPDRPQSAGSSAQSGPLTSPGPARSAASTIVYA